ncbi:hypothetical protein LDENG_00224470 [Lucifuga dentata]|nr:hypothetical protein LDENG_00224470 [Lucifuga dentata]
MYIAFLSWRFINVYIVFIYFLYFTDSQCIYIFCISFILYFLYFIFLYIFITCFLYSESKAAVASKFPQCGINKVYLILSYN